MTRRPKKSLPRLFVEGLRTSVTGNAYAYGFSIMITLSLAVLIAERRTPTVGQVFLFLLGAVSGFVVVEAVASRGFRSRDTGEPPQVVVAGSALAFVSVSAAVGAAALLGEVLDSGVVWPVGAFCASAVYTLLVGVEMMVAARAEGEE
jgi:hypothetical protein